MRTVARVRCQLLLITGSTRGGSTNTAVLRTAQTVAPAEANTLLYERLAELPAFNPDDDHDPLPEPVDELRRSIRECSAILLCTPEYAGALPGAFKNLLDWTIGDGAPGSIYRKPVAWINASSPASPSGGAGAHESLATVLGYVGADIIDPACRRLPLIRTMVSADGLVTDPDAKDLISRVVQTLVDHVAATTDRSVEGPPA